MINRVLALVCLVWLATGSAIAEQRYSAFGIFPRFREADYLMDDYKTLMRASFCGSAEETKNLSGYIDRILVEGKNLPRETGDYYYFGGRMNEVLVLYREAWTRNRRSFCEGYAEDLKRFLAGRVPLRGVGVGSSWQARLLVRRARRRA
jgi:hypothetical protein